VSIGMLVAPYDKQLSDRLQASGTTLPMLRFIVGVGGYGPAHAKRMQTFCQQAQCRYMGVYGQTEVTGTVVAIFDEDYFQNPYSCGKPLPGIDLALWNDAGQTVGENDVGEIMIRSKTCIPHYWKNEQASQTLYSGEWLHTGDLAQFDKDGFLYFIDRKKELIKTGGENVYPKEVEKLLLSHPAIADAAVIGLPDIEGWGERVTAVVVLKETSETIPDHEKTITTETIKAFCQGKIAGYKIPKQVHCVNTIPRNFTGKPLKQALKKTFASREETMS